MSATSGCECYFLDVGQGTSQILYLGRRRAVVIDGDPGEAAAVPLQLLQDLRVKSIEALIVTHNHADHQDGAVRILSAYKDRVKRVAYLVDRQDVGGIKLFDAVGAINDARRARGHREIEEIRLERDGRRREVLRDDTLGARLVVLYPDLRQNISSVQKGKPNATSGILRFVFARDVNHIPGGRDPGCVALGRREGRADLLHHLGGTTSRRHRLGFVLGEESEEELNWLYTCGVHVTSRWFPWAPRICMSILAAR